VSWSDRICRSGQDIDIIIKATAENVERLREAFRGAYPSVRYYPPTGDSFFDVLTKLGEVASYETVDSQQRFGLREES
jgi:hypothetical protein